MNKINNYNKEEHIQFIEALIKTEQVAVFINNMDISEQSKVEQNDTLEYLYNRIIELQNNWNELKRVLNGLLNNENDFHSVMRIKDLLKLIQKLEQGKDE